MMLLTWNTALSQLPRTCVALGLLCVWTAPSVAGSSGGGPSSSESAVLSADDVEGPHISPVDEFHPSKDVPVEPAYGGEIAVHLESMPKGLNRALENSGVTRYMLYELNDTLVLQDWEMWDYRPSLAKSWDTEDQIVLQPSAAERYPQAKKIGSGDKERHVLFGELSQRGDSYSVAGISQGNETTSVDNIPAADVVSVQKGTVFTFHLPDNVKWHDGHPFDAHDVLFSWDLFNNEHVDCDQTRFQYLQVLFGELVDDYTVRFIFEKQYFHALQVPGEMCILPRHLFDLTDPDNVKYDPATHKHYGEGHDFTDLELADYINKNPHNTDWVGLGPYRVTSWEATAVKATRFEDYHDPSKIGYVDNITWRMIADDNSAFQALINSELDYFARVKSEDYFGAGTDTEAFKSFFYKGYFYTGSYGIVGWNTLRPILSDKRVRQALDLAFDWEDFIKTQYYGLAKRVTGPQNYFGPGYNRSVKPLGFNIDKAEELLAEAGWYDRDGDGIIDKDGVKLEIEFLYPSGNAASVKIGLEMQESFAPLGIKMNLQSFEWSTFLERMLERNFDAVNLAWAPDIENDPEQLWHSKWGAPDKKSSNMCGVQDPQIDALIAAGQVELDDTKRAKIWQELHAYIADLQPYMFGANSPRKFAMNKKVRGFQSFKIMPGYSIRRWHYPAGTPGTRATVEVQ